MNIIFTNKQKLKIAMLLFFVMACALLIRMIEDRSLTKMEKAFVSIYNDRLVPASDLIQIAELLYQKRQHVDVYLNNKTVLTRNSTSQALRMENIRIDFLVKKYETTYFVTAEKGQLDRLKKSLAISVSLESQLLDLRGDSKTIDTLNRSYLTAISRLSKLSKIQMEVGGELTKNSQRLLGGNKLYSNIQVCLAIVIGLLIMSILYVSKVITVRNENFRLN